MMARLGFDRPIWQQYLDYLWKLLHGDFWQLHRDQTDRFSAIS